jgi:hypothetical protein
MQKRSFTDLKGNALHYWCNSRDGPGESGSWEQSMSWQLNEQVAVLSSANSVVNARVSGKFARLQHRNQIIERKLTCIAQQTREMLLAKVLI